MYVFQFMHAPNNRAPPSREATLLQLCTPHFHGKYKGNPIFGTKKVPFNYAPPGRRSGGLSIMQVQTYWGGLRPLKGPILTIKYCKLIGGGMHPYASLNLTTLYPRSKSPFLLSRSKSHCSTFNFVEKTTFPCEGKGTGQVQKVSPDFGRTFCVLFFSSPTV